MMPDLFARLGGAYLASQADTPSPARRKRTCVRGGRDRPR